jgi:2-polyprenyl-3-methyl-5-hydroxy-6-metoxy-1,4-benzoquinol methylase
MLFWRRRVQFWLMSVAPPKQAASSADVLLANQLYYNTESVEYDKKNHVNSRAIHRYYEGLFDRFVFAGHTADQIRMWRVCDIGCGTGFLETILHKRVGSLISFDATMPMLQVARRKLSGAPISWVMADAQALPFDAASFELVCSNAMLHHVYDVDRVAAKMASLVKPGGKLFVGYEPNAIPYSLFWPLLKVAAKIVPEHRHREKTRLASGQDAYSNLKDVDIHELAEYHVFTGRGIHPFKLRSYLNECGIVDTRVHFTSLYQAALLRDSGVPLPLDALPDWFYRLTGRLSLSFTLTGSKPQLT